jgi:predicted nucleic acid-binding protein
LILVDTSGLLTALNERQPGNAAARQSLDAEQSPAILSPFVLAETDYFVTRQVGLEAEISLLADVAAGAYRLAELKSSDVGEAARIIERYADLNIGLTDASIVVLAGRYGTNRVLTFDERHFRALRTPEGDPFVILPADARATAPIP